MEHRYTFRKSERLYHKKDIQELFDRGSSFYLFPFRIIQLQAGAGEQHQVLIMVSKRNFKRAADRNRLKRQIREAYRLHKHLLDDLAPHYLGYIYTPRERLPYFEIERGMIRSFQRMSGNQKQGSRS